MNGDQLRALAVPSDLADAATFRAINADILGDQRNPLWASVRKEYVALLKAENAAVDWDQEVSNGVAGGLIIPQLAGGQKP